ncbi:MAG: folate family ECF transporter S component [Ruminiclostridium sp.]|nr:folate family ECF transporter S component [Ruminiclostridium sp.]
MGFFVKFGKSAMELKSLRCITVTGVLIALDIVLKMVSIKISADLKITFAYLALATIGMLYGPTVAFLAGIVTDLIGFMLSSDGGFSPFFTLIEAIGAMIYGIFLYDLKPLRIKKITDSDEDGGGIKQIILKSALVGVLTALVFGLITFLLGIALADTAASDSPYAKLAKVFTAPELWYISAAVGFLYGTFFGIIIIGGRKDKADLRSSVAVILSKVIVVVVCNLILNPVAFVFSGYMSADSVIASYPVRVAKNAIQLPVDCLLLLTILFPILAAYRRFVGGAPVRGVKDGRNARYKSGENAEKLEKDKETKKL